MEKEEIRKLIAKRIANELKDGDIVNLGIGLPVLVANYIPKDIDVIFHSENGIVGMGQQPEKCDEDKDLINAGGVYATALSYASFFDTILSFGIIRGGHLDVTVLGALQVDQEGCLANWMIPGKIVPGMGGAMDLVSGSKRVIIATEHTDKHGNPKLLKRCTLPLTGIHCVDTIVTELGYFKVSDNALLLKEYNDNFSIDEILENTEAKIIVDDNRVPLKL